MNIHAGQDIYIQTHDPDRWYRIIKGWVQLRQPLPDGREVAIMLLGPGDLIMPVPAGQELIAEALIATTITLIDEPIDPVVWREMIVAQSRLLTAQHNLVTDILVRDRMVRLVTVLLELTAVFGSEPDDGMVTIGLRLTDDYVARMTAMNWVTVTHALLRLRANGMLVKHGHGSIAVNVNDLRHWLTRRLETSSTDR